jgi:hypothetical protein
VTFFCLLQLALLSAADQPVSMSWDPEMADDIKRGGFDVLLNKTLNEAMTAVTRVVGVPLKAPIEAKVYAARSYERAFGAASAGRWWAHYSEGKVHINGGLPINAAFKGLLVHELTHAVLDSQHHGGAFPVWLNEGLAEYLQREALGRTEIDPVQRVLLKDALRKNEIGALSTLRQPLETNAYLASFAAVSLLMESHGRVNVLELYRSIATGTKPEDAWKKLGADPDAFNKTFSKWIADYGG